MNLLNVCQFALFTAGTVLQQLSVQLEIEKDKNYIKQIINGGSVFCYSLSIGLIKIQQTNKRKQNQEGFSPRALRPPVGENKEVKKIENVLNNKGEEKINITGYNGDFTYLHELHAPIYDGFSPQVGNINTIHPPVTQPNSPVNNIPPFSLKM